MLSEIHQSKTSTLRYHFHVESKKSQTHRSRVEQWFPGFGETFVEGPTPVTRWLPPGDVRSMKSAVNNAVLCVHFRAAEPGS